MALAAGPETQVGKLVIRNIGLLLSGKLEAPILDADTIVAEGGKITAIGRRADCDTGDARITIDAKGCAVSPGLIDSHVHPVFGDWTPRQSQLNWIDSFLHGGVTTMVSAGDEAKQMVAWARKYGIQSTIHTGGPSASPAPATSTLIRCWRRMPTSSAISTAATPRCRCARSAACARAARAASRSSTTATNWPR